MTGVRQAVAGIDFGGQGLDGARWVASQLEPERLILAHALHLPRPPSFLRGIWGDEEQIELSAHAGAEARLEDLARHVERETGVRTEARIRVGAPAEEIAAVADSVEADLIVLGPHSRRRGRWDALGSTAERVIHETKIPTLLAIGDLHPPRRLLAAVNDGSVEAGIFGWVRLLRERTGAEATALNVIDNTMEMTYRAILAPQAADRATELEAKASEWLAGRLDSVGLSDVEAVVALGDPTFEILTTAERVGADLLLLGTHGAGAAARILLGGTARLVARGARCPLLLLPRTM